MSKMIAATAGAIIGTVLPLIFVILVVLNQAHDEDTKRATYYRSDNNVQHRL